MNAVRGQHPCPSVLSVVRRRLTADANEVRRLHQALACRHVPREVRVVVATGENQRLVGGRFSAGGNLYVACSSDKPSQCFYVYSVSNRRRALIDERVINCRTGRETCAYDVSPNEQYLVYAGNHDNDCMMVAGMDSSELYTEHRQIGLRCAGETTVEGRVNVLEFSSDSSQILAVKPSRFSVYDVHGGGTGRASVTCASPVAFGCFADSSAQTVLTDGADGTVAAWDVRSLRQDRPTPVARFGRHRLHVQCVSSRRDGRYFLSSGVDDTVKLWDLRRPATARKARDFVLSFADGSRQLCGANWCTFSPLHSTGQRLISYVSSLAQFIVCDALTGAQVANVMCAPVTPVFEASWHPQEMMVAAASYESGINILL